MADQLSQVDYRQLAIQDAQHFGVPPQLFLDQINQESGFNPNATNGNAAGIAQFMPATAISMGVADRYDASQALYGAAAYDKQLYDQTGSWQTVVQRYGTVGGGGPVNAGQTTVFNDAMAADAGDTGLLTQDVGGQAPTSDFYSWLQKQGVDPGNPDTGQPFLEDAQHLFADASPEQQQKAEQLYQEQTGQSPFGPATGGTDGIPSLGSSTGSSLGSITGLSITGVQGGWPLAEHFSGALNTNLGGTVKLDTANQGGISGLVQQGENWATGVLGAVETDIGNAFLRWGVFLLGILLVIGGVLLLKPVQEAIIKTAQAGAEVA